MDIAEADPPTIPKVEHGQRPEDGEGPRDHRRYAIEVGDAKRDVAAALARRGDTALHGLYDKLGIARPVQSQMWVIACERFAELVGGTPDGPVQVPPNQSARAAPRAGAGPRSAERRGGPGQRRRIAGARSWAR